MLEVHDAQRLAQVVMRARRKAKLTLAPNLADDHVVLLGFPDRH